MMLEMCKMITLSNTIFKLQIRNYKTFRNHYEVLNLKQSCSAKEIRDSFLKLSKEYHPDKNKASSAHKKFIQLSEAYSVLSKPDTRQSYDLNLSSRPNESGKNYSDQWQTYEEPVQYDQAFYYNRNRSQDKYYEAKPYYGIKGLKRVPNYHVVIFCLCITAIGVSLQMYLIMKSFTLKRERLMEQSIENGQILANVRKDAIKNGKEKQLELLKQKLGYTEDK